MSAPYYTPQPGSAAARVVAFLKQNPDEELSSADVAEKFNLQRNCVQSLLSTAVKHGALTWARNDDLTFVYSLGVGRFKAAEPDRPFHPLHTAAKPASPFDGLSQLGARQPSPALPKASKPSPTTAAAHRPTPEDFAELVVEDNVPVDKPKPRPELVWAPLFEKLQAPGQSIQIPEAWRLSLAREVGRRNALAPGDLGPRFKVGKDHTTTHARIWRTA